jgi:hypothetical protein
MPVPSLIRRVRRSGVLLLASVALIVVSFAVMGGGLSTAPSLFTVVASLSGLAQLSFSASQWGASGPQGYCLSQRVVAQSLNRGTQPRLSEVDEESRRAPPPSCRPGAPVNRYLTYEPHSGLHNQRIELMNGLMLALLLNRTLVVPPLRLGAAAPFRNRKAFFNPPSSAPGTWTFEVWEDLFNLRELANRHCIRILPLCEFELIRAAGNLHTMSITLVGSRMDAMDEAGHQEMRDVKVCESALLCERETYGRRITLDELNASSGRSQVLSFQSLFASDRVRLIPGLAFDAIMENIKVGLRLRDPGVVTAACTIRRMLGERRYSGVHLRLGDHQFHSKYAAPENRSIILGAIADQVAEFHQRQNLARQPEADVIMPGCQKPGSAAVYLATDAPDHPAVFELMQLLLCTFTLADFAPVIAGNAVPPFHHALVEVMVLSASGLFIPAEKSTMSAYVNLRFPKASEDCTPGSA